MVHIKDIAGNSVELSVDCVECTIQEFIDLLYTHTNKNEAVGDLMVIWAGKNLSGESRIRSLSDFNVVPNSTLHAIWRECVKTDRKIGVFSNYKNDNSNDAGAKKTTPEEAATEDCPKIDDDDEN